MGTHWLSLDHLEGALRQQALPAVSCNESALAEEAMLVQKEALLMPSGSGSRPCRGRHTGYSPVYLMRGTCLPLSALSARDCISETPCNLTQRGASFGKCFLTLGK